MRILITGAAGFIGMHVACRLLARGDTVLGVDNLNSYYQVSLKRDRINELQQAGGDRFQFLHLDFADENALQRAMARESFDRIVHLGAQAGVRYSIENPGVYAHSNLIGHLNMLELGRQRQLSHVVYASSSSVYGANATLPFSVEDRADSPISFYAATKRANELMSESYAHLYRLPLTGLRFFTVYGPWGRPDMALWIFTAAILAGKPVPLFNHGRMRRDFTFIADIVTGTVAALDSPPQDSGSKKAGGSMGPHALYNIGNSQAEEMGHVLDVLSAACGRPAKLDYKPMQPGDVSATFAEITAIQQDLGYQPTTSIEEGIPRFVEWFRHYHAI